MTKNPFHGIFERPILLKRTDTKKTLDKQQKKIEKLILIFLTLTSVTEYGSIVTHTCKV